MPFGGYRQSGWGREMGREVLEACTEDKPVCAQLLEDLPGSGLADPGNEGWVWAARCQAGTCTPAAPTPSGRRRLRAGRGRARPS
ncbi:hypothetical protein ACIBI9_32900 [Nonomuraea sp. NPDC050451]|uniref:hypothetical protein n=1 Tax=Nonomuraea sp. NPDC050451 TaxID=3364364 RepID=UPI003788DDE3